MAPELDLFINAHFLIIEDSETCLMLLREYLLETGAKITHFTRGEPAIDFIKQNHDVDLVLLDIKLPGISGRETCKALKAIRPDLIVIAQSASAMKIDEDAARQSGCCDFIRKPIIREDLIDKLKSWLL